jgi:hypothetical protein
MTQKTFSDSFSELKIWNHSVDGAVSISDLVYFAICR